uniref:Ribosomal protein S6 n=1 Tax=Helicotheca tamesis TaxID=374047 RepID=A0A7S2IGM9_9STRA|mmetsp:Transcript_8877/g.12272  ORF Transcript_8877/g.12272 Transcript_8877/m.12272 type:complete len:133 (+) Transcript_8877:157-555(+)|eukprot:CAMPEP_0185730224 /NCGR_PEP_ID=MMETSP1171-20130828/8999_1 /TAXON_ID=374046 /ORGANISM="Helicotheca tamensis, Strain CCMP826" /LENGTH=132 /DNA_ID=CAMNT_0028399233 /DNA_START=120 /DNA_END=518 /DNA_ORIENTATION=-
MVFYECVLTAKNTAPFTSLTKLMKTISSTVVENGGIVRTVQNHGIRNLPHRFKAKYPDKEGNRYYKKGRFISVWYDASPRVLAKVENEIRLDDQILRHTHLKARNKLWYINIASEKKNPYIQKVIAMEKEQE